MADLLLEVLNSLIDQFESKNITAEELRLFSDHAREGADQTIVVNRKVFRGTDPFAIQQDVDGRVKPHIRRAHNRGPGFYTPGPERDEWLYLAAISMDESKASEFSTRERINFNKKACGRYRDGEDDRAFLAQEKFEEICSISYNIEEIQGVKLRTHATDLGLVSAFWGGLDFGGYYDSDGLLFIGTKENTSLEGIGIKVNKEISPQFGIIGDVS